MRAKQLQRVLGVCASVLLLSGNAAWAAQTLEFSIRWDTKDDRYRVFMKPNATPSPRDMSMTGQVTILVPHAKGADRFVVSDQKTNINNTLWKDDSRVDAPEENPNSDYISFSLNVLAPDAFQWQAGKEVEVFSFRNAGKCIDGVRLIENQSDPFNQPILDGGNNSAGTNPGNQFTNLGWGDADDNNYLGNYGPKTADCTDSLDSDGDGLKNGEEKLLGTDPTKPDSDGDGLPDGAEVNQYKTDPTKRDTDGDGLSDGAEINQHKTDPTKPDSDGDGLSDSYEANTTKSNPLNKDSDGDGVQDNFEVGTDQTKPRDTDGDGILDILDTDDDGDGILTKFEKPDVNADGNPADAQDMDKDGKPDYLDTDDNGDGIPTKDQNPDGNKDGDPSDAKDSDGDGKPDYLDDNNKDGPKADLDGDGLTNEQERQLGTDPTKADSDGDGLSDGYEANTTKSNPLNKDSDGDGVQDNFEVGADQTKPRDTDGDGILDILDTDDDGDGILTKFEKPDVNADGNPADAQDTDKDGKPDYLDTDDNGDGIPTKDQNPDGNKDGDPSDAKDSDGDGKPDYLDDNNKDGPKADLDGDGLTNEQERQLGTDPTKADTDGDGLPDGAEVNQHKTDPTKPDTDGDGLTDSAEINQHKTDPTKPDTDGDGLTDGAEINQHKTDPTKPDTDGDGLKDGDEVNKHKTDPLKPDTDGDGIKDGDEVTNGTNPLGPDAVKLKVRAFLQGAYNSTTRLMADNLRTKGLLPLAQPYNIGQIKYAGKEVAALGTLNLVGNDAPVDWVLVEIRDAANPATIKARLAGLLQRDGDVMDATTGNDTLTLTGLQPGNYHVAVRHRNHLGVMTAVPAALSPVTAAMVDFTKPSTTVFGNHARLAANNNSVALLWAGNANVDNRVIANGPSNDTGVVLGDVLLAKPNLTVSTNYRLNGYQATDINLDGVTIFAGPGNDVNILLGNVLLHPGNATYSANYIINQQLP